MAFVDLGNAKKKEEPVKQPVSSSDEPDISPKDVKKEPFFSRIISEFVPEHPIEALEDIAFQIVVPMLRQAIFDSIASFLKLKGTTTKIETVGKGGINEGTRYDNIAKPQSTQRVKTVMFESENDAHIVLERLRRALADSPDGSVSIAQFYAKSGSNIVPTSIDTCYGWKDLRTADVTYDRDLECWKLKLPITIQITPR